MLPMVTALNRHGMPSGWITGIARVKRMALASVLLCVGVSALAATSEHYRVLLLHSFRQSAPVNSDWYSGIARGFERVPDLRVDIDVETLDMGLARDESYVEELRGVYRHKYADPKPQLIIATYTPALRFPEFRSCPWARTASSLRGGNFPRMSPVLQPSLTSRARWRWHCESIPARSTSR